MRKRAGAGTGEKPMESLARVHREFRRGLREHSGSHAAARRFCEGALEALEKREAPWDVLSGEESDLIRVSLLSEASFYARLSRDYDLALRMAERQLAAATALGDDLVIQAAYHSLGATYEARILNEGDPTGEWFRAAERHYQKALGYTGTPRPYNSIVTLEALARLYTLYPHLLDRAVMLYEWILTLDPTWVEAGVARYRCFLEQGEREWVEEQAGRKHDGTPEGIADVFAARTALNWRRRALRTAEEGLAAAREAGERRWVQVFQPVVERESPGQAAPAGLSGARGE